MRALQVGPCQGQDQDHSRGLHRGLFQDQGQGQEDQKGTLAQGLDPWPAKDLQPLEVEDHHGVQHHLHQGQGLHRDQGLFRDQDHRKQQGQGRLVQSQGAQQTVGGNNDQKIKPICNNDTEPKILPHLIFDASLSNSIIGEFLLHLHQDLPH